MGRPAAMFFALAARAVEGRAALPAAMFSALAACVGERRAACRYHTHHTHGASSRSVLRLDDLCGREAGGASSREVLLHVCAPCASTSPDQPVVALASTRDLRELQNAAFVEHVECGLR